MKENQSLTVIIGVAMNHTILLVLCLAFFFVGCAHLAQVSTTFQQTGNESFSPLSRSDQVAIYLAKDVQLAPTDYRYLDLTLIPPYKALGFITISAAQAADASNILTEAIEKARSVGANAIIITSAESRRVMIKMPSGRSYPSINHYWSATAVRVSEVKELNR